VPGNIQEAIMEERRKQKEAQLVGSR
jgi:hypothetical protein